MGLYRYNFSSERLNIKLGLRSGILRKNVSHVLGHRHSSFPVLVHLEAGMVPLTRDMAADEYMLVPSKKTSRSRKSSGLRVRKGATLYESLCTWMTSCPAVSTITPRSGTDFLPIAELTVDMKKIVHQQRQRY